MKRSSAGRESLEELEYQQRKLEMIKKRRKQSRIRRMKRRIFRMAAVLVLTAAVFFVVISLSRFSFFRGHIDVAEIEMPDWIQQEYIEPNPNSRPQTPLREVNGVVVHYVGNPGTTAQQNQSYFNSLAQTHENYASSHFIIGMDGEIIQCIPMDEIAYCSNERNYDTLSIECCHPDDTGEFTEETYASLIKLTQWLCETFRLDTSQDVIRHYDVTGKECPRYYVNHPKHGNSLSAISVSDLNLPESEALWPAIPAFVHRGHIVLVQQIGEDIQLPLIDAVQFEMNHFLNAVNPIN